MLGQRHKREKSFGNNRKRDRGGPPLHAQERCLNLFEVEET